MTDYPEFVHAACDLRTRYGMGRFHCYQFGPHEEDNILCLQHGLMLQPVLVRVQSACYSGEIFQSTDCDCHEQLDESLTQIFADGGIFIYMICDGRGAGLLNKIRGLALGELEGLDTFDAYVQLGLEPDPRSYNRIGAVLRDLGVTSIRLLTNNPRKVLGLEEEGIGVERLALEIAPTKDSRPYLATKKRKMGHLLEQVD
ncbi:MAG: GTP cyclohydrolase II [Acidimicrobiales bacterium]